jgi:hypothetical protein
MESNVAAVSLKVDRALVGAAQASLAEERRREEEAAAHFLDGFADASIAEALAATVAAAAAAEAGAVRNSIQSSPGAEAGEGGGMDEGLPGAAAAGGAVGGGTSPKTGGWGLLKGVVLGEGFERGLQLRAKGVAFSDSASAHAANAGASPEHLGRPLLPRPPSPLSLPPALAPSAADARSDPDYSSTTLAATAAPKLDGVATKAADFKSLHTNAHVMNSHSHVFIFCELLSFYFFLFSRLRQRTHFNYSEIACLDRALFFF